MTDSQQNFNKAGVPTFAFFFLIAMGATLFFMIQSLTPRNAVTGKLKLVCLCSVSAPQPSASFHLCCQNHTHTHTYNTHMHTHTCTDNCLYPLHFLTHEVLFALLPVAVLQFVRALQSACLLQIVSGLFMVFSTAQNTGITLMIIPMLGIFALHALVRVF